MSELKSLDSSLPQGLGLYEIVTVGVVGTSQGEPHLGALHVVVLCEVVQAKPGDHGLVVQDDVGVAIDPGIPTLSRAENI